MSYLLQQITLQPIAPQHNSVLAAIIRRTLEEHGAAKPGTVYFDPTTDALYELFRTPRSHYFVALHSDEVLGGAGIYPTAGLPKDTCELVKIYLKPEARGIGLGRQLMQQCFDTAQKEGFAKVYLESMPELSNALSLYEGLGFRYLNGPMGQSGHTGCGLWMLKDLTPGPAPTRLERGA